MSEPTRAPPATGRAPEATGGHRGVPPRRRMDLQHAFRIYRLGHDRGWDRAEKEERARRAAAAEDRGHVVVAAAAGEARGPGGGGDTETGGAGETETGGAAGLRYGVPIPETLSYHRGAGTWRDRVRGFPRS